MAPRAGPMAAASALVLMAIAPVLSGAMRARHRSKSVTAPNIASESAGLVDRRLALEQPRVDNVLSSLEQVEKRGTVLKFHTGSLFPGGYTFWTGEHFQGIQRIPGSNYLVVSGNGKGDGNGTSHLFVVDMASSSSDGHNALGPNAGPPASDRVVDVARFDYELDHAGGFSIWGNYLAVGTEHGEDKSRVHFFDVSQPSKLVKLDYTLTQTGVSAGAVALQQEQDGRFLLVVAGWNSDVLQFYRSSSSSLATDPGFSFLGSWNKDDLTGIDTNYGSYQSMNMVMQQDGKVFLIGFHRHSWTSKDWADVFEVTVPADAGGRISLNKVGNRHLTGTDATFRAGAGFYVASPQEMMLYSVGMYQSSGIVTLNEFPFSARGASAGEAVAA